MVSLPDCESLTICTVILMQYENVTELQTDVQKSHISIAH